MKSNNPPGTERSVANEDSSASDNNKRESANLDSRQVSSSNCPLSSSAQEKVAEMRVCIFEFRPRGVFAADNYLLHTWSELEAGEGNAELRGVNELEHVGVDHCHAEHVQGLQSFEPI
jgi:hypothetical protein